jgi:hypothetical protein
MSSGVLTGLKFFEFMFVTFCFLVAHRKHRKDLTRNVSRFDAFWRWDYPFESLVFGAVLLTVILFASMEYAAAYFFVSFFLFGNDLI